MWSVFMIRVHCRNLVTVNDLWFPHMECRNLITFSDSYGPPYLIRNRYLMAFPTCMIWFFSGQLWKRSTACPNNKTRFWGMCATYHTMLAGQDRDVGYWKKKCPHPSVFCLYSHKQHKIQPLLRLYRFLILQKDLYNL